MQQHHVRRIESKAKAVSAWFAKKMRTLMLRLSVWIGADGVGDALPGACKSPNLAVLPDIIRSARLCRSGRRTGKK
jgi:hypothetical protein